MIFFLYLRESRDQLFQRRLHQPFLDLGAHLRLHLPDETLMAGPKNVPFPRRAAPIMDRDLLVLHRLACREEFSRWRADRAVPVLAVSEWNESQAPFQWILSLENVEFEDEEYDSSEAAGEERSNDLGSSDASNPTSSQPSRRSMAPSS